MGMSRNKPSMKDIAVNCGTSITTVSFVVNGLAEEKSISPAMTKKIQNYIAEVGYRPHSMAQGLRTGKSKTIGFLVDDISEPFFSGIAKYVDEKAAEKGYKILFCCTGNDPVKTGELLSMLSNRNMDGYIIALAEGVEEQIVPLLDSKVPMVLFDRYLPGIKCDQVTVDNYDSVYRATIHLIENGYSKITYLTPKTSQQQMIDRLNGYYDAMEANLLPKKVLTINLPLNEDLSLKDHLINDPPDAFIFGANYLTMYALRTIIELNSNILNEMGMVSFDDLELLKFRYFRHYWCQQER